MISEIIHSSIIVILSIVFVVLLQLLLSLIVKIVSKILVIIFGLKVSWIILNVVPFIGTIHHELCHALLVILSGAKLLNVKLFRVSKYNLGKVTYAVRGSKVMQSLQNTLISIAPTLLGVINSILILRLAYNSQETWIKALLVYTGTSILLHSRMSKQDIKIAKSGLILSILLLIFIIFIIRIILKEIYI